MLEKVNEINWKDLKHAYGEATDVPRELINLASQDDKTREKALYNLYGNIFHQGTRYEATPYAIPFLFELLKSEEVKEKHEIILYLVNLALGYEEEFLPNGFDPKAFRKEMAEAEFEMSDEDRHECEKYGYSTKALLDCYDLVKDGIPIFYNLVSSSDPQTNTSAIYALSWFPEKASESIEIIQKKLNFLEDPKQVGNAILAIGLLVRQATQIQDVSILKKYLDSDSELVKTCAAIALANEKFDSKVFLILTDALSSEKDFDYQDNFYFNGGDLKGLVSLVLTKFGKSDKENVFKALISALKSVNPYQSLNVTSAILSLINQNRETLIKDEKIENLSETEVLLLNSILDYGGWKAGVGDFVNYSELLKSAGIPDKRDDLARFLKRKI